MNDNTNDNSRSHSNNSSNNSDNNINNIRGAHDRVRARAAVGAGAPGLDCSLLSILYARSVCSLEVTKGVPRSGGRE